MTRTLLLPLLLAACAFSACTPAPAASLVDVTLLDRDDGQSLPTYRHRREDWVPGIPGHRYAVRLTNTTGARVLVVLSVDGVNAVSGEDADPSQAGYVLGPWQSTEVAGWRKSMDDIAQFYFTDLPDSYAARTGRPGNVGVVGVAVFRERQQPGDFDDRISTRDDAGRGLPGEMRRESRSGAADSAASPAPSARAAAPQAAMESAADGVAAQRIGTGHGQREWSPVSRTGFVRASSRPAQVSQLRYDRPQRLIALGIVPRPRDWSPYRDTSVPRAFPGGFAADPPSRD